MYDLAKQSKHDQNLRKNQNVYSKILLSIYVILVLSTPALATGTYAGGAGTSGDPYQISNSTQLVELSNHSEDWGKYFVVTADIDLTSTSINPIGSSTTAFSGEFDGDSYTISNYSYTTNTGVNNGLFGYVTGTIKEVLLEDATLTLAKTVTSHSGTLVGQLVGGDVIQCGTISPTTTGGCLNTGGLVGRMDSSASVEKSFAIDVDISDAVTHAGGLIAYIQSGTVDLSFSTGSVVLSNTLPGGACGDLGDAAGLVAVNKGTITNCYSRASASVGTHVDAYGAGGLVADRFGTIVDCYSTGVVSGTNDRLGGFTGWRLPNDPNACFWDSDVNSSLNGHGENPQPTTGLTGETTANMKKKVTFTDDGWDFKGETTNGSNDYWTIDEDSDYPVLVDIGVLLTGDMNNDWLVDPNDIDIFFESFKRYQTSTTDSVIDWDADLDSDGDIDRKDFNLFSSALTSNNVITFADLNGYVGNVSNFTYNDNWLRINHTTSTTASDVTFQSSARVFEIRPGANTEITILDDVIGNIAAGNDAKVTIDDTGGNGPDIMGSTVLNDSSNELYIKGGNVGFVRANSGSSIEISDGTIHDDVELRNDSTAIISGGTLKDIARAFNDSTMIITGGTLEKTVLADEFDDNGGVGKVMISGGTLPGSGSAVDIRDDGSVWVFGSSFKIDNVDSDPNIYTYSTASRSTPKIITLKGTLSDSTALGTGTPAGGVTVYLWLNTARLILVQSSWATSWTALPHATGDADGDDDVDCDDKTILDDAMDTSKGDASYDHRADFDHDFDVDSADETIWDDTYTGTCP